VEVLMKPKITRFDQTAPGDLFVFSHSEGQSVAITAHDATEASGKAACVLGPSFPLGRTGPCLIRGPGTTLISFEKNFKLRLPTKPSSWSTDEPQPNIICCSVTSSGNVLIRANSFSNSASRPCYINIATGEIDHNSGAIALFNPLNRIAFALEWDILSDEPEPRIILSYPFSN